MGEEGKGDGEPTREVQPLEKCPCVCTLPHSYLALLDRLSHAHRPSPQMDISSPIALTCDRRNLPRPQEICFPAPKSHSSQGVGLTITPSNHEDVGSGGGFIPSSRQVLSPYLSFDYPTLASQFLQCSVPHPPCKLWMCFASKNQKS